LVTIEYQPHPEHVDHFLRSLRTPGERRGCDGAFAWGVFEDTEWPNNVIKSFCVESWLKHLRQHERLIDDDRALQDRIRGLSAEGTAPRVLHYVTPSGRATAEFGTTHDHSANER
jgi:hypothetical protein